MLLLYPGRINNLVKGLSTNETVSRHVVQTRVVPAMIRDRLRIEVTEQCDVVVCQTSVPVVFDNAC